MLPIDEMLIDLRARLEAFDMTPSDVKFAEIQSEVRRIMNACETVLIEHESSQPN
jgi:hypothetical protein